MATRELSPELLELAVKNINEDPKRRDSDIESIKKWLKKQPHLTPRKDDQWILTFLRGCKFSLERTKEKIDTYYTYKTILPEFFGNRDPLQPELQEILKLGSTTVLPKPDKLGRNILVIRTGLPDPKKHKILNIMRVNYINMDTALLSDDRGVIAGDVVILDFKGMTFDHMSQMTPAMVKKSMLVYQDAYPIRPQSVHCVNTNTFFEKTFGVFKSFMKKKLQDRIYVHGSDMTKLHQHISKDLLPEDYNGDLPSLNQLSAEWKTKVESYRDWFVEDSKYGSDEKKRVGKPKNPSDIFGVEGSFRSLSID